MPYRSYSLLYSALMLASFIATFLVNNAEVNANTNLNKDINKAEFIQLSATTLAKLKNDDLLNYPCNPAWSFVKNTDWYASYVCYSQNNGLISIDLDGTFNPNEIITRAEGVKIMIKIYEAMKMEFPFNDGKPYKDLSDRNKWYFNYVKVAADLGITDIKPYKNTNFYPNENLTIGRAEKMMGNLVKVIQMSNNFLPDLQIIDIVGPSVQKAGEIITYGIVVKNMSSKNINTPFSVIPGGAEGISGTIYSLGANETITLYTSSGLTLPGQNQKCASVDTLETITESNESNNIFCKTVYVAATYTGEGVQTLNHWESLQLENGLILRATGGNIYGQTPYKVNFEIYDPNQNYKVIDNTGDLTIDSTWSSQDIISQMININVIAINVQAPGNANWSITINVSSESQ